MNIQELQDWIKTHYVGWGKNQKPLYDSLVVDGQWRLSAAQNVFVHNLQKVPLLWTLLAAVNAGGTNPVEAYGTYRQPDASWRGVLVSELTITQLRAEAPGGIGTAFGWHQPTALNYLIGTHRIRCLIWTVEE